AYMVGTSSGMGAPAPASTSSTKVVSMGQKTSGKVQPPRRNLQRTLSLRRRRDARATTPSAPAPLCGTVRDGGRGELDGIGGSRPARGMALDRAPVAAHNHPGKDARTSQELYHETRTDQLGLGPGRP